MMRTPDCDAAGVWGWPHASGGPFIPQGMLESLGGIPWGNLPPSPAGPVPPALLEAALHACAACRARLPRGRVGCGVCGGPGPAWQILFLLRPHFHLCHVRVML